MTTWPSSASLMDTSQYSQAQFNANAAPAALGRGRREDQNKKNAESAKLHAATLAYNRTHGLTGRQPSTPRTPNAQQLGLATPGTSAPYTPVPMHLRIPHAAPGPQLTSHSKDPVIPQTPRTPLQPVMVNSSHTYMDFSQSRSPVIPMGPPTQGGAPPDTPRMPLQSARINSSPAYSDFSQNSATPGTSPFAWAALLSESQRARLIESLQGGGGVLRPICGARSLELNFRVAWNPFKTRAAKKTSSSTPMIKIIFGRCYDSGTADDGSGLGRRDYLSQGMDINEQWTHAPDEGPRDIDEPPPVSSLECTMRTVQPRYQNKRKRRLNATNAAQSDADVGISILSESPEPRKRKHKSRSIATISDDHQTVCKLAFHHLRMSLTHKVPFPVSAGRCAARGPATTDEFNELVLDSFTNAAFDVGLEEAEPTPEDIKLIRSRVPTFRGGLKDVMRDLVPSTYDLEQIETLKNPTPELINATLEKNRARVDKIIKTFIYSHGFTGYWFGENENNCAFYFEGKTRVELVTLALIIVAVRCAIQEWSTGRWKNKAFTHRDYFKAYTATLDSLQRWMAHSETQVKENGAPSNLTIDLQERLLRVARATVEKADEQLQQDDGGDLFVDCYV
ncbi:hypothetical protein K438DRAFT_1757694 [Mycena galopus ATCC 62051]|nr:hypothetical protein K438DRAFT_1757694 [Mycena galopus ATCC 62051]